MIYKKLFLLFLLFLPSFPTRIIFREEDTEAENTTGRSPIMRKMNRAGSGWSDNETENIETNRSLLHNVIRDIMSAAPDMEDKNYTMEARITIKKCCGPTEVLDEWYRCSERGTQAGMRAIANLTDDSDLSEISFQYQSFFCPKRKIHEYSPIHIFKNGSIEIEIERNRTKIIPDYFCLDQTEIQPNSSDGLHVIICDSIATEAPGKITKCCKSDEVLDYDHGECVSNPDPASSSRVSEWLPPRYIMSSLTSRATGQFNIQYSNFPSICNGTRYNSWQLFAPLFTDGTAVAVTEEGDKLVPYTCLDRNLRENSTEVEDLIWVLVCDYEDIGNITAIGNQTDLLPRMNVDESETIFEMIPGDFEVEECRWEALRNFYSFLCVVSIICLMATAYVYIKVKEIQSTQGKIVLCNVVATLFVNLYLLIVYNSTNNKNASCIFLGYFGYFASLNMFSWMSVMCFNLIRRFVKMSLSQGSQKQFLVYCAVGIGFPLSLSLIAGILQASLSEDSDFNPSIGAEQCFVGQSGNKPMIFFHLPVFLVMLSNIIGFLYILLLVTEAQWGTETTEKQTKEQMFLYIKMSISLGLPWIFESIHYTIHKNHEQADSCQSALETFFGILSILNCSRGIILFFIFVCKRSVWKKLQRTEPFRNFSSRLNKRNKRETVLSADTFISLSYMGNADQKRLTNVSMK